MGKAADRKTLTVKLKSWWDSSFGPLAYPNATFVPPNDAQWAAASILYYDTDRASLGSSDYLRRTDGSLQVDLFVPGGMGTDEAWRVCDRVERDWDGLILRNDDGDSLIFGCPDARVVSGNEARTDGTQGNWFHVVVDCPFRRDTSVVK